jgi:hypothetical protein
MEIYDLGIDSIVYYLAWNDVTVQDPYQYWYLTYVNTPGSTGGELWGTRNALRLSVADADQQWGLIVKGIVPGNTSTQGNPGLYNNIDVEFSRDLNHLYISTGTSNVTRVDGLGSLYASSPTFNDDAFYHKAGVPAVETPPNATLKATLNPGGIVEGIAVNPTNADDVLFLHGFGSIRIKRSAIASSASPTYNNITLTGNAGTYDALSIAKMIRFLQ